MFFQSLGTKKSTQVHRPQSSGQHDSACVVQACSEARAQVSILLFMFKNKIEIKVQKFLIINLSLFSNKFTVETSITPLPSGLSMRKLQKEGSILPHLKSKFSHLLLRQMLNSKCLYLAAFRAQHAQCFIAHRLLQKHVF